MERHSRRVEFAAIIAALVAWSLLACEPMTPGTTPNTENRGAAPTVTPITPTAATGTVSPEPSASLVGDETVGVRISDSASLGNILTDYQDRALYVRLGDEPFESKCLNECLSVWPAFTQAGPVIAPLADGNSASIGPTPQSNTPDIEIGEGALSSMVSSFQRSDGIMQITYNGWPLYYYTLDNQAQLIAGRSVEDTWGSWTVINANGEPVQ